MLILATTEEEDEEEIPSVDDSFVIGSMAPRNVGEKERSSYMC